MTAVMGVIQQIYMAAMDPSKWESVLADISSLVDSAAGSLWIHDFSNGSASINGAGVNLAAFHGLDVAELQRYAQRYSALNVWTAAEERYGSGSVVSSSMLYPDSALKKTEFYGDWLRHQDLFYALGSIVEKRDRCAVKMSFLRSERAGGYSEQELHVMRTLMPHLRTAVAIHQRIFRLEVASGIVLATLDTLALGVMLISEDGKLLHSNRAANRIAERTGAFKLVRNGLIDAGSVTKKLQACVGAAACHRAAHRSGELLKVRTAKGVVTLCVAPLAKEGNGFGGEFAAAVFCSDPEAAATGLASRLSEVYSLTPAEAALTEALVSGKSLKEFADERCTTLNTVRTQLRAASDKVGAKRQVDLVRTVLTGPAVLQMRPD